MPKPSVPSSRLLQQVWDGAARQATDGADTAAIVARALDTAGPRIAAESQRAVPAHGWTFWSSMAKAVGWGAVAITALLVVGSFGARAVPILKVAIWVGVAVWAIGFGVFAGHQKVRGRRAREVAGKRAEIERVAQDAARYVWAHQVPGSWQPLGPAPETSSPTDGGVLTAWLRRLGLADGQAAASVVDGTETAVRQAIAAARGRPVVLFVPVPGSYTDDAQAVADACGVALFVVGRLGLQGMSRIASRALKAYLDPASTVGPVGEVLAGWAASEPSRDLTMTVSRR
jgi:hypothetical protein